MPRITASNCHEYGSGTLIRVSDEVDRIKTDDIEEHVQALEVQTAVTRVLEKRGYAFDEEDNEWVYLL